MDALFSLIPGGSLTAIGAAILAALLAVWRVFAAGKRAGRAETRAKEADSYEKHLEDLARGHDARNRVDGRLPDNDPYRRD